MWDFFVGVGAAMRLIGYRAGLFVVAMVFGGLYFSLGAVIAIPMSCVNYGRARRGRKALPPTAGIGSVLEWAFDRCDKPVPWKVEA